MPLLPCSHCEAEFYPVIARRVAFSVIARSAATKHSPVKVIATPCIQRGAGLAMTESNQCEARRPFRHLRGPKGRSNLLDEGDSVASLAMTIWANESWHSQLLRTGR